MANIIGRRVNVADMAYPSGGSGMRPMRPGVAPAEDSGGLSKVFSALASPYLDGVGTQLKQNQADLYAAKVLEAERQNQGVEEFASTIQAARNAGGAIDPYNSLSAAARGGLTGGNASDFIHALTANTLGANDPRTTNSGVGAKMSYGSTPGGFRESESNDTAQLLAVTDRNIAADRAKPLSVDQLKAREIDALLKAGTVAPEDKDRLLFGNDPAPRAPFNYVVNGQSYLTTDGVTDVRGAPLPPGGARAEVQGDATAVGLRPPVQANLQAANIAQDRFRTVLGVTRDLASKNPSNFGIPGIVKGAAQDVSQMATGLASGLGYSGLAQGMEQVRAKAQANGVDPSLLSGLYDPNLPALHSASDLLVYAAAEALAGQSGRSVTDRDVQIFKRIAGDPSEWAASQEKFLSKLSTMEDFLNATQAVTQKHLGGPGAAVPAVPGAAPAAPPAAPGAPPGAKQAADGNFYVPDPARPGKYLMVQP